jgi:hypothetical protein
MYEPVQICVGLALAPCESVLHGVQTQLERTIKKEAFRSTLGAIEWREFFEGEGLFYDIKSFQIALFSPYESLTVYVCNLADGWVSLYGNLVKMSAIDAYFFRTTLSEDAEFKVFEMMGWHRGVLERELRVLQDDDGWKFVNKGEPRSFENPLQYKRRQVGARLDRRSIERYSEAVGYSVASVTEFGGQCWRLWRSGR